MKLSYKYKTELKKNRGHLILLSLEKKTNNISYHLGCFFYSIGIHKSTMLNFSGCSLKLL
jgi:hypothetical protein